MARSDARFRMRQIKMSQDRHTPPRWLTLGSLFFLLLAVILFVLSVRLDARSARLTSLLVPVLLVAVLASTAFHLFFWRAARRRRIADDAMVYSRERELSSIFEHAL